MQPSKSKERGLKRGCRGCFFDVKMAALGWSMVFSLFLYAKC